MALVRTVAAFALALVVWGEFTGSYVRAQDYQHLHIDGASVAWPRAGDGAPLVLTYGFASGPVERRAEQTCPSMRDFGPLLVRSGLDAFSVKAAAGRAFERWSRAIDVRFVAAGDGELPNILLGAQAVPAGTAFTSLAIAPGDGGKVRRITAAAICLNPERRWKVGFDGDLTSFDLEHVFSHEIGHVLGLDHPGARGHVMAFRYLETILHLTAGDIAGATALYGARGEAPPVDWRAATMFRPSIAAAKR